ncbi:MAG: hypothetical protein E6I76_18660 [Chloroflexi bacterium]|nr:MAG: hypothetical protein E6I76_18660 [Chloroflexota bacterium]
MQHKLAPPPTVTQPAVTKSGSLEVSNGAVQAIGPNASVSGSTVSRTAVLTNTAASPPIHPACRLSHGDRRHHLHRPRGTGLAPGQHCSIAKL